MTATGVGTVLVVDDEADVADAYAAQLGDRYEVETAYSGTTALEALDASVDVVLLDRRMPGISGEEVLAAIRERDIEACVAMVTAVDPAFDIIEMPFDDYVVKPVSKDALVETVEQLYRCSTYHDRLREYYALTAKHAALTETTSHAERDDSEAFQSLEADIEAVRASLDNITAEFEVSDYERAFAHVGRSADYVTSE
ncbi:response regulator [Haloarcula marina]|uniref:response regulator n=1 Tax=Haloarcula marina TaxID=2961574 RepID=UPI0020B6668B|nr:response regulator [Halomicroarcula marina]